MKRTDIEKVLKQGSVRQKIKLYMTDIALVNVDWNNLDYDIVGDDLKIKGTKLLSDKERGLLWSSIKEPNDKKYYEELRTWNKAFLMFKDKLSIDLMTLQALYYLISISNEAEVRRGDCESVVNDLLDIYPDKNSREKALRRAIELTGDDEGTVYQENGYPKYLALSRSLFWEQVKQPTEKAIEAAQSCKQYIAMFKRIVTIKLPLKPYRDWLNWQELRLKKLIELIYEITTIEGAPPGFPKIKPYEEIEAQVTDEDVEDFKDAGR